MSCAGKGYGTNPQSNNYLYAQFYTSIVTSSVLPKTSRKCRRFQGFYPSFTPKLFNLSVNNSAFGEYTVVYINGANFLPNGTTFVNFGNYTHLPVTYYSSFNISFVVPINANPGTYNVQVVNLYNGNFSPSINNTYPGVLNLSNSINYTITKINYLLSGSYTITSDSNYNTIITFTDNGTFSILSQISAIPINYIVVGGGGGGGGANAAAAPGAGGGGGGGVITGLFNSSISIYNINIGVGGLGGNPQINSPATPSTNGSDGSSSSISGIVTASGGSGGKSSQNLGDGGNSGNGGAGGTGNTSPGGNGINGGGGGGSSYSSATGGNGSLSTTSVYYYLTSFGAGGGGGGGGDAPDGIGGNVYAGNGGVPGKNATPNYGGGGGGSRSGNGAPGTYGNGGNGGSGRVILYFNN